MFSGKMPIIIKSFLHFSTYVCGSGFSGEYAAVGINNTFTSPNGLPSIAAQCPNFAGFKRVYDEIQVARILDAVADVALERLERGTILHSVRDKALH
jgi:hypothetical protein